MSAIAERYMKRDKDNRIQDLDKAMETLKRLKEYEEKESKKVHDKGASILWADNEPTEIVNSSETYEEDTWQTKIKIAGQYFDEAYFHHDELLRRLLRGGYKYLARDKNGDLWAHNSFPYKHDSGWSSHHSIHKIEYDQFTEVQWSDEEPTKISELLESYENGGENGKWEVE